MKLALLLMLLVHGHAMWLPWPNEASPPLPVVPPRAGRFSVNYGLGALVPGVKLRTTNGTWRNSPTSYSYQWERCSSSGTACSAISGATSQTYTIVEADEGHDLTATVTASNSHGSAKQAASPVGPVESTCAGACIFVAQAGKGAESGASCATAHSIAWLNEPANWAATKTTGKVSPGYTVALCGEVTEAITAHASGKAGEPITIEFLPGAKLVINKCALPGCIYTNTESHLVIRGASESQHGTIEVTGQGTGKEEGTEEPEGNKDFQRAISAEDCEGCAVEDMNIENLYVKTSESDLTEAASVEGIRFSGAFTISHDNFTNIGWALYGNWLENNGPVQVEHDTFSKVGHAFAITSAFFSAKTVTGPIVFAHNEVAEGKAWNATNDINHQDGVHCYRSADVGTVAPTYADGIFLFDNRIGWEMGYQMNSAFYLEGATGPGCASSSSKIWLFNNVTIRNELPYNEGGNGGLYMGSGEDHVFDNTFIGPENTEAGSICVSTNGGAAGEGANAVFKNNIVTTCGKLVEGTKAGFATGGLDYNLYAGGDSNRFICEGQKPNLSEWRTCAGEGSHGKLETTAKVKTTRAEAGVLEAGSPAEGTGANLKAECEAIGIAEIESACGENILGDARPSTGAWDIGAY